MAEIRRFIGPIADAEKARDWNEAARLCRAWIAGVSDITSNQWYYSRVNLIKFLRELATPLAIDDWISTCHAILDNKALAEPAARVPLIHMSLGTAYTRKTGGDTDENLRMAINHLHAAYESIDAGREPVLRASIAQSVGEVYLRRSRDFDLPLDELNTALAKVREAIEVFAQHERDDLLCEGQWLLQRLAVLVTDGGRLKDEDRKAIKLVREGKTFAESGESGPAIAAFTEAIALAPELGEAYFRRADLLERKGDYDGAAADYSETIRLEPNPAAARNNRGLVYHKRGRLEDAINDFTEAIRIGLGTACAYYNRGNAYRDNSDLENAIVDYTEAIRLDPRLVAAWHNRGNTYANMGELDKAIADFTEAIRMNPDDASSLNSRGIAHKRREDFEMAIADYDEAIRVDSRSAEAYLNRGNLFFAVGRLDESISDYSKAIEVDPELAIAYYGRGRVYAEKVDETQAIADFSDAVRLNPVYAEAFDARGRVYQRIGEIAKADWDFRRANELRYHGRADGKTGRNDLS